MNARLRHVLCLLVLLLAVAGCGNKGDLVLPDEPDAAPAEAPPAQ
jgi:predicted small lipoprotein YifL